jgi:hypothetical protein
MPEKTTERRSNWAPWLALLLVLAVIGLNVAVFLGIPGQRLIPWLSLALALAAVIYAAIGLRRAFGQSHLYGGKISGCIFGALALLMFAMVVFGQYHARDLPASSGAPQVGQKAPDFTLSDSNGNKVSLGQLLGSGAAVTGTPGEASGATTVGSPAPKAVLLIFYRGYW